MKENTNDLLGETKTQSKPVMPLSSYILPLLGGTAMMGFSYLLGRFGYSSAWIAIFVALNFLKSKMWKAREKKLMGMRATSLREKEVIMSQLADLPSWVQFPDTERVEWVNKVVLQAWPYVSEYVKQYMKENVEPMVKAAMPGPFKSFRFEHIDMGDVPCRLHGIKVYTENVGRDRVIMDMDVAYAGDCEFQVGVGAFRAGMTNLQFTGKLRAVLLPLLPYPPMVGGVSAFFLENPQVDFSLTGIGEMVELPGLMTAVRAVVKQQMAAICVLPNQITVPLVPNIDMVQLQFPEPDGVIRIHVVRARDLENKDMTFIKKGRSDPYAVLTLGNQVFKTKVIDDNLSPEWDEFYEAVVSQASGQRLRVELYDEDAGSNDEELGRVALALDTIRDKGSVDEWYALDGAKSGQLQLKMYWLSLSRDPRDLEVDQWESEWLKANRTMHSALLMVYVDHASDLPFPKVGKEPSPYITVELAGETKQTFPKFKTINPLWQEKFIFFMSHPESQQLKIEAIDDNTKRSLGTCTVSTGPILSERNLELYQQQFNLSLGTHQSPLVLTVRLRPLRGSGQTFNTTSVTRNSGPTTKPPLPHDNNNSKAHNLNNEQVLHLDNSSLMTGSLSGSLTRSKTKHRTSFMTRMVSSKKQLRAGSVASLRMGSCGQLHCVIGYLHQNNRLSVNVVQATGLNALSVTGTADAYCQLQLQTHEADHKEKTRTAVTDGTLNPVWDEAFEFSVHPRNVHKYSLTFKVKDAQTYGTFSKPPVLGKFKMNLASLDLNSAPVHECFDLEPPA